MQRKKLKNLLLMELRKDKTCMDEKREDREEQKNSANTQIPPVRSMILWLLAGVYLLYIGYNLCKGTLNGEEGAGWGFFVVGVAFIIIGVVLLFLAVKNYNAKMKADRTAEAAAGLQESSKEIVEEDSKEGLSKASPDPSESPAVPSKPMTIAERARLTERLDDPEEEDAE